MDKVSIIKPIAYSGKEYQMLKNMKIRSRMLLSYTVIIILCLAASVAALIMMKRISGNLTSFYDNNYNVTVNVWTAKHKMQYARADILEALLETDRRKHRLLWTMPPPHSLKCGPFFPISGNALKGI